MMNMPKCTYSGRRDEALVEYLYGEDGVRRRDFAVHLEGCRACRAEVEALGGVRQALTQWAPPEPKRALERGITGAGPRLVATPPATLADRLQAMPLWAQAAAAILCVGVAAGMANVRMEYGANGLAVTTGWLAPPPAPVDAPGESDAAASRAELTALEERLRGEMRQEVAVAVRAADADAVAKPEANEALMRRVRALVAQSEQRQQRELALRIGDVFTDMQAQRRADLSKIDRTIGVIQNNTGMEVMRQREMLNSLAVRVSSQR